MSTTFAGLDAEPTVPVRSLSPSGITKFMACPEKFRRMYLKEEWESGNAATVLGNAFHAAQQANMEQKVWSAVDLPWKQVRDAYFTGWERAADHDDVRWGKADVEQVRDTGVRMAWRYHDEIAPTVMPAAVEERFHVEIPGVPVPLVGRLDVRTLDQTILDTKTSGKAVYEPKPDWRVQALCYMAAFPEHDFQWHVQLKDKGFPVDTPATRPKLLLLNTAARRHAAHLLVRTVWTQIEALYNEFGEDEPWSGAGLTGFSCRFCHLWKNCVYWA